MSILSPNLGGENNRIIILLANIGSVFGEFSTIIANSEVEKQ